MSRSLVAAAATVLALALVGCTDDPEPQFADPTETPSVSVSSSPTEAVTTPPPTTDPPTPEPDPLSPEETVRAWVEARNELLASGDATAIGEMSTQDCQGCEGLIQPVVDTYARGGSITSDGWDTQNVAKRPGFRSNGELAAAIDFAEGVLVERRGADPSRYPSEKNILRFTVSRDQQVWKVSKIVFLS